jgi:hypothetical protein
MSGRNAIGNQKPIAFRLAAAAGKSSHRSLRDSSYAPATTIPDKVCAAGEVIARDGEGFVGETPRMRRKSCLAWRDFRGNRKSARERIG